MSPSGKTWLLEQIAAIPTMERGKLSAHSSGRHQKPWLAAAMFKGLAVAKLKGA